MSELFKEAIIEARKLKEVAEIDARNKVIEAVTPIIKKMIAKESADTQRFLFGEDDVADMEQPELAAPDMAPPTDAELPPAGGDVPNAAPISPAGELVGMPMPDEEGKITVDFSQLFSLGAGSQGVANAVLSQEMVPPPGDALGAVPPAPPEVPPVAAVGGGEMAPAGIAGVGPEAGAVPGAAAQAPEGSSLGVVPGAGNPGGQAGAGAPLAPEEEPEPVVAGESKLFGFENEVRTVAERIDILYFRGSVPALVKESVKSRLFTLCEQLDKFVQEGVVSPKKARIAENKLEFLFMKLNEAEERNSYNQGAHMTSLKEFAAKLFEEDALGPATADKATAHAEKVSGVQPGVDLFKEGEAPQVDEVKPADDADKQMAEALLGEDAPASSAFGDGKAEGDAENKNPPVHNPDALAKEPGAGIVESAPASTAFGDGEKAKGAENHDPKLHKSGNLADEKGANSILEFDEKELREAVAKLRKENLARKIKAIKESAQAGSLKGSVSEKDGLSVPKPKEGDQGSAKPVGGKDPAQSNLAECMDEVAPMDMPGEGGDMPGAGGEVELTFSIDVDDLEALLNGAADEFTAEPNSEVPGMQGGDEEIEVVDDTDAHDMAGGDDGEGLLLDKEPGDEEETKDESAMAAKPAPAASRVSVKEGKTAQPRKVDGKKLVESLTKQLREQELLTAKALYVSKFTVRDDLTKNQKQKIAEYFDKTTTLAEAKETYVKIKKILAESASPTTKLAGSASKPTTAGSAKLNESAASQSGDQIDRNRWMLLAGIKDKK